MFREMLRIYQSFRAACRAVPRVGGAPVDVLWLLAGDVAALELACDVAP